MSLAATASPRTAAVPLIALVIAGCVVAAVTNGIRNSFGLFTLPVTADLGISRETWAMAMARPIWARTRSPWRPSPIASPIWKKAMSW